MLRLLLALTPAVVSGCSLFAGPGVPPPAVAAAAAGAIVAYPAGVSACLRLERPDDREACVEVARDAFETSIDVFNASVDAEIERRAAP